MTKETEHEPLGLAHLAAYVGTAGRSQVQAAKDLRATQATLSRRIERVEKYFGGNLFRSGSSGALTARGLIALQRAEAALLDLEDTRRRLDQNHCEIILGYMPVMEGLVHKALRLTAEERTSKHGPDFHVRFRKMTIDQMIPALRSGQIDLAVSYARSAYTAPHSAVPGESSESQSAGEWTEVSVVGEIKEHVISDIPFGMVVPEHVRQGDGYVEGALNKLAYAYSPPRSIVQACESWLAEHKLEPARRIRCEFGSEILGQACTGRGWGLLPLIWKATDIEGAAFLPAQGLKLKSRLAIYSLTHLQEIALKITESISALTKNALRSLA